MVKADTLTVNTDEKKDYKFVPDKELLDFAILFSNTYKELALGDYKSGEGKYHLRYEQELLDEKGDISSETVRIDHDSKRIEFSHAKLEHMNITSNFVFFLMMWIVIEEQVRDRFQSDVIALQYYLSTNRSRLDYIFGLGGLLHDCSEETEKRLNLLKLYMVKFMLFKS